MMLFQRRYRSVICFINLKLCDQSNFPPPPSAFYFLILCHQLFFSFSQESSTNSSCIVELSPSVASCTNWLPVSSLLLPVCSDEWMVSFKLPLVTQVVVYAIRPTSWKQLVPFRFAFLFFFGLYPIKVTKTIAQLRAAQCSFSQTHKCVNLPAIFLHPICGLLWLVDKMLLVYKICFIKIVYLMNLKSFILSMF